MIVHAALPVNADPGSAHGFEITDLPEITQAATILHRGPTDNVMATIQTLARWIDENGYRSSGHVRELTLECPDDPDKWVTELREHHHACMTTPTASRRAKSAPARSQRRPPGRGHIERSAATRISRTESRRYRG